MTNRKIEYWVIPPEADAEFVAHREEVLETYEKPYNPNVPVLCMDEQPVQLLKETRSPMAATAKHGKRVDYEYERAGTAAIFLFAEPLAGWRDVAVRERKTKSDWAIEMARLLEGRYATCGKVILEAIRKPCRPVAAISSSILAVMKLRATTWRKPVKHKMNVTDLDHSST